MGQLTPFRPTNVHHVSYLLREIASPFSEGPKKKKARLFHISKIKYYTKAGNSTFYHVIYFFRLADGNAL